MDRRRSRCTAADGRVDSSHWRLVGRRRVGTGSGVVRVANTAFSLVVVDDSPRVRARRLRDAGASLGTQSGAVDVPLGTLHAAVGRRVFGGRTHDVVVCPDGDCAWRAARARRATLCQTPLVAEFTRCVPRHSRLAADFPRAHAVPQDRVEIFFAHFKSHQLRARRINFIYPFFFKKKMSEWQTAPREKPLLPGDMVSYGKVIF